MVHFIACFKVQGFTHIHKSDLQDIPTALSACTENNWQTKAAVLAREDSTKTASLFLLPWKRRFSLEVRPFLSRSQHHLWVPRYLHLHPSPHFHLSPPSSAASCCLHPSWGSQHPDSSHLHQVQDQPQTACGVGPGYCLCPFSRAPGILPSSSRARHQSSLLPCGYTIRHNRKRHPIKSWFLCQRAAGSSYVGLGERAGPQNMLQRKQLAQDPWPHTPKPQ